MVLKWLSSFSLPQEKPTPMVLSQCGQLICTDDRGNLFKVEDSFWRRGVKEAVRGEGRSLLQKTSHLLMDSLKWFARCVQNYTMSYFRYGSASTHLALDPQRDMAVVLCKKSQKKGDFCQTFFAYSASTLHFLYGFSGAEIAVEE